MRLRNHIDSLIEQGFVETWDGSGEYERRVDGDFGFRILITPDRRGKPRITVALPHQCDAWEIVDEVSDRKRADATMEKFIEEARAAYDMLLTLRLGELDGE